MPEKQKRDQKFFIPSEVFRVSETLQNAGFEAYLVGGCVRDLLLGREPKDWDITTNALPEETVGLFEKTFYENDFGTVGVVNEGVEDKRVEIIEVTTYRLDAVYSDNRHPDSVQFSKHLPDDLKRRDFTINAIAYDISKGHIIDPYKGQDDLACKIVHTVGNPDDRFKEDALRLLRAVRIATELGFSVAHETEQAIEKNAMALTKIAVERIRDEFVRIMATEKPMEGIMLAHRLKLLPHIVPELEKGIGIDQNQAHTYDVWEHNLRSMQHAAEKKWELGLRLAALFHDIGKPETRKWSPEKRDWTFHGHDVVGSRVTRKVLERLKFDKKTIDKVSKLVRWHMFFSDTEQITLSAVRRILRNVGEENIWDLMNLRICDRVGTGRPKEQPYRFRKYKAMIEEVLRDPISVGMLAIDGNDLMELLKISPGPKIGNILHALLEEVLDDPALNTKEYLQKRALDMAQYSEMDIEKIGSKGKLKKTDREEKEVGEIRKRYWVE